MRSVLAGLRNLVLPWGARAGRRIVLDGGNAAITVYDTAGNVVATIDANGIKSTGADGSALKMEPGGAAQLLLTPPTVPGVTWDDARIQTTEDGTAEHIPKMSVYSPSNLATPGRSVIRMYGSGVTRTTAFIQVAADTTLFMTAVGADGILVVHGTNGRVSVLVNNVEETWHPVAYLNGWSDLGGGYVTMQYRKVATPPRSVQLVGVMNVGTKTSGAVIANLPAGYRPLNKVRIPVSSNGSNAGGQTPAFDIQVNGDITVATGSGFPAAATDCEVCAVFPLDA